MGLNSLIDLAIRRSVLGWTLFIAVLLFGILGFRRLGVSQLPDVDFPVLNITITQEGASPQVISSSHWIPSKSASLSSKGLSKCVRAGPPGMGTITLNLSLQIGMSMSRSMKCKPHSVAFDSPCSRHPPIIRKQNPEEDPIPIFSVTGKARNQGPDSSDGHANSWIKSDSWREWEKFDRWLQRAC